jgi:hypothetical protein
VLVRTEEPPLLANSLVPVRSDDLKEVMGLSSKKRPRADQPSRMRNVVLGDPVGMTRD